MNVYGITDEKGITAQARNNTILRKEKTMEQPNERNNTPISEEVTNQDTVFYTEEIEKITDKDESAKRPLLFPEAQWDDRLAMQPGKSYPRLQLSLAGKNVFAMNTQFDKEDIVQNSQFRYYLNANDLGPKVVGGYESPEKSSNELINIDYKLPLNVALLARKNLSDRWAIETGLSYTYLASQETWHLSEYNTVITNHIGLHYLGIPLKASYTFYQRKQWSVYLAGGGMLEKCVLGEIQTQETIIGIDMKKDLDVPELQVSFMGNIGITYRIAGPLGIFIEPGFGYFIDDKSDVMTIRKDKPLTFNIQGGLRFDL
jgi:hypothetical protein